MVQHAAKHRAIALLITVMFIMVISVAIGYGLTQVNKASQSVKDEMFMYQNTLLIDDVVSILQKSPDLLRIAQSNNSIDDLNVFLLQTSLLPLSIEDTDILITIRSARSRFNVNDLNDSRKAEYLRQYLTNAMINGEYVTILFDVMNGEKEDGSYNSAIFDRQPYLFRDYIASQKHLDKVNAFYKREFNDNSLKNIDFSKLFAFGEDVNGTYTIDLNYATPQVWEMMLGCSKERAQALANHDNLYYKVEDLDLEEEEKARLSAYKTSFYEPYLFIKIALQKQQSKASVSFEYDIKKRRASHFVYEI